MRPPRRLLSSLLTFTAGGACSYWWSVFSGACAAAGAPLHVPSIFPAATDSRWIRLMLGTPCFGFSPMR